MEADSKSMQVVDVLAKQLELAAKCLEEMTEIVLNSKEEDYQKHAILAQHMSLCLANDCLDTLYVTHGEDVGLHPLSEKVRLKTDAHTRKCERMLKVPHDVFFPERKVKVSSVVDAGAAKRLVQHALAPTSTDEYERTSKKLKS